MFSQLIIGFGISAVIGGLAYRNTALSKSGVLGAILTGTAIFGFGDWVWGMALITFFISSSLLSKYKHTTKQALAEKFDKGAQRDLWQALANAGAGALLAFSYTCYPHPALFFAFIGAMATVNADTWATEIGVLSQSPPRLITNGKVVDIGTSGGVSLLGTLATLGGGFTIGLITTLLMNLDALFGGPGMVRAGGNSPALIVLVPSVAALSGLAGALVDSFLGATVQAIYYSPVRKKETEKVIDPDGTANEHRRGWHWLNNDWVNFISSIIGAAVSGVIGLMLTT